MTKLSPFDFVNSITGSKDYLIVDDVSKKAYNPFMVNKALSYWPDTIMYANEMNHYYDLDHKLQYDFLINSIRSRKRGRTKWAKKNSDGDLAAVMEYYEYSMPKAEQALSILSPDQIEIIKKRVSKGGTRK
tara:strand:- start:303 stop:695 length:393 start_codon:yes stop_codon:yes gene_type:complete